MAKPPPAPSGAVNIVRNWDDHQLHAPDPGDVLPWELALERLAAARLYWHVTQTGEPTGPIAHVRPVFGVVCDGVLCSTSSARARKTERLERDARCTLAASTDDMDLVYDGVAVVVGDVDRAQRVAEAYRRKYGWPVEVTDEAAFDAPFAAPSAGPPPFLVYAFEPTTVRGVRHRRPPGPPLDALGLRPMSALHGGVRSIPTQPSRSPIEPAEEDA